MRKFVIVLGLMLPVVASAATPPEGVPLKVRRGFFTETDIGGFLTLGGQDGFSNLQVYLQLGVGYDITENFEIGLHVGIGANAANCWSGFERTKGGTGDCVSGATGMGTTTSSVSDNFTVTFIDLSFAYLFRIVERLYIAPKVMGGFTLLDPAPAIGGTGDAITKAGNFGFGASIEYATNMDHFTIGLDITARVIVPSLIFSLQFFPRVKYTF